MEVTEEKSKDENSTNRYKPLETSDSKEVRFSNPVVSSIKHVTPNNKGRKIGRRYSSRDADNIDNTNYDYYGFINASIKSPRLEPTECDEESSLNSKIISTAKDTDDYNVKDTALEMIDEILKEFLADEKSEIREINKMCLKITEALKF